MALLEVLLIQMYCVYSLIISIVNFKLLKCNVETHLKLVVWVSGKNLLRNTLVFAFPVSLQNPMKTMFKE